MRVTRVFGRDVFRDVVTGHDRGGKERGRKVQNAPPHYAIILHNMATVRTFTSCLSDVQYHASSQTDNNEQDAELRLVMPMSTLEKLFGEELRASPACLTLLNDVARANKRVADAQHDTKLAQAALLRVLQTCTCGR